MSATMCLPVPIPAEIMAPAIEHLEVPCCEGSANLGWEACTCWEPVYAPESAAPDPSSCATVMPRMCGDCAFRRNSPERRSDPHSAADWDDLQRLVATETPFWCHDGMPRLAGWRHPSGVFIPAPGDVGSYRPRIVDGIPYRADGRAGSKCAGWAHAVNRQAARDADTIPVTPLGALLARRPELRGIGISSALEARWTA